MKKTIFSVGAALLCASMLFSCGKSDDKGNIVSEPTTDAPLQNGGGPNYRFVNMDSIFLKYNLSIDFTEQMLRLTNDYEAEQKKKINSLTSKGKSLEQQYDNIQNSRVQLPSEVEAFQKDYADFQNQSNRVQQELMQKEMQLQQTQAQNLQIIVDSVQNFLKIYAPSRGYEAIFMSSDAPYYHPSLDVTNEVVEGLNARYNKVTK